MPGQTYAGASGRLYPYLLVDSNNLHLLPMEGGGYIFARNDVYRTPVFVGAAESIREAVLQHDMQLWKLARVHGAKLVLIHVDAGGYANDREVERRDLIEAYRPAMNSEPGPAA